MTRRSHRNRFRLGRQGRTKQRHLATAEPLESRCLLAVVISEFLADNGNGSRDLAGHRHDWIELQNTGSVAEDLGGWYLSDDPSRLTKFQFPSSGALTTLEPGERLLVYASGDNGEVGVVNGELHTNFRLSQEPGYLGLVRSDGSTIESEFDLYPQQTTDISYGSGIDIASHTTTSEVLVGDSSFLTVVSPTGPDAARDDHWKEIGYDDSGWLNGIGSVGFDRNGDAPDLTPFIDRVLTTSEMDSNDSTPQYSAYVRYEFDAVNKEQLTSLELNLRFDDGFIAYLNGKEIARANFAEDFVYPQPQWNSYAGHQQGTSSSSGNWNRTAEADELVSFTLTPFLESLVPEGNVLAFHAVNSRSGSGGGTNRQDFLIDAQLVAERAVGITQTGFLSQPSPGRANGIAYGGYIADTEFSVGRGIYETPQLVELSASVPDATIRFTTDFSEPTLTNGSTYMSPISISSTTVLRVKAFKPNFIPTNIDTSSYIFPADVILQSAADVTQPYATWGHDKEDSDNESGYNLDDESDWEMDPEIVSGNEATLIQALKDIPSLSVVTDWDNLWSGTALPGTGQDAGRVAYEPQGIYIHGRSSERPNSLEYVPSDGGDSFQVDSVIEIQGHSSPGRWKTDKLSFQVKFKSPLADPKLSFDLFANTADGINAVDEFDTLILDAGYNYGWTHANLSRQSDYARFVTDQVTADLQNLASGRAAFHGKFVHLYLDGLYWGIYNVHERPDEHFAAEYYGGERDDIYVVKHSTNDVDGLKYTWVNGGLAAETAFHDLLEASREDMSSNVNYAAVEQILDTDHFLDYMIVHMYAGNKNDWPHNNWYGTFNSGSPDGRWRFHAWDQEHAFPTDDNGDAFDEFVDLTDFDIGDDDEQTVAELFVNLMGNDEFRLRFSDRAQELLFNDGVLTPNVAQSVYETRTDEIDQAIFGESARWGDNWRHDDPYTRDDFIATKNGVFADFFPVRTATVLTQFQNAGWFVPHEAPEWNQYGGEIPSGFQLTMTNPNAGGTIYYTLDGSDPRDRINNGASDSAILYTGPVLLNESTRVRARVLSDSSGTALDWSPEVDKVFQPAVPLPLRIVELMYHPSTAGTEYIEVLNTGDDPVDVGGVRIADFSSGGYTFAPQTIEAGERLVVPEDVAAFSALYPEVANVTSTAYSGSLSNGGESISLRDPLGGVLQAFTYDDASPWATAADGEGYSLEYTGPLDGQEDPLGSGDPFDQAANWRASLQLLGTPGSDGVHSVDPDFNDDGVLDEADINLLQENIVIGPADSDTYDLSGDGLVNVDDRDEWLLQAGAANLPSGNAYLLGDANLDGVVDVADFNAWNSNKFSPNSAWSAGDFTVDGVVDVADFNVWNANKFTSAAALPLNLDFDEDDSVYRRARRGTHPIREFVFVNRDEGDRDEYVSFETDGLR